LQEEEKVKKKKEPTKRARKLQTKDQRSATLNLDIKIKPNKASSKFGKLSFQVIGEAKF
jgi:hypothetical protein